MRETAGSRRINYGSSFVLLAVEFWWGSRSLPAGGASSCNGWYTGQGAVRIIGGFIRAVFSSRKGLYFDTVIYFIVTRQTMSNYKLIRLKRFISC